MKDRAKKLRANIWQYNLYEVLTGMFFVIPVIVLFWQSNGLSLTEIMVLQSIFSVLVVALEIPTGYFADLHGRRRSLVFAGATFFLGIAVYSVGYNFTHFLIAEIFFAFALSFKSGADSAFVYDTLIDLNEEKQYKRIWGQALFFRLIAMAVSSVIGGIIAEYNMRLAIYASLPLFALLAPVALSFYEPKRHKLIFKKGYATEILTIIRTAIWQNQKLKWLVLYAGVVFGFNQAALWLYQPYFQLTGVDVAYFGVLFASFHVVAALASRYAHVVENLLGQPTSLGMLIFLVAGCYFLMSNFIFLFSFSFVFLHQFVRGFKNVVVADYVNRLADASIRATVLSVESFVGRLLYAIVIPFVGLLADVYSLTQALAVLAFTTLGIGIMMLAMIYRYRVI